MAQRKQGINKIVKFKFNLLTNTNDVWVFGQHVDDIFGINAKTAVGFKVNIFQRIELMLHVKNIVHMHALSITNNSWFIDHQKVSFLVRMMISICKHGFSKRIKHDFEMHWNANPSYKLSEYMCDLKIVLDSYFEQMK